MRVVVALGGNALLRRGQPLTHETQHRNIARAAAAVAELGGDHELVLTHGNGPQVGLLAVQDQAVPGSGGFPLDVLSAETAGMIGYLLAQELQNELPDRRVAAIITQVEVDPSDAAFARPTKPIGPVYPRTEAEGLAAARGWRVEPDGDGFRRVVPSPAPVRFLEIDAIRLLVAAETIVVCAGGGGVPVVFDEWARAHGVEAVIDKDRAAALLAIELAADALLLLTDVQGIFEAWGSASESLLREVTPDALAGLELPEGSMGPKARAAADFVTRTDGVAGIGAVEDAAAILRGQAGTRVRRDGAGSGGVGGAGSEGGA